MRIYKPCPFCGGKIGVSPIQREAFFCDECGYIIQFCDAADFDEAVEAMNMRAERTCRIESRIAAGEEDTGGLEYFCSECGFVADPYEWDALNVYCPNCGAKVVNR